MTTTVAKTTITVELPEAFDQRWNRLPGITVDGKRITIDPETYFFRFENSSWLVIDWETVKSDLLHAEETETSAVEQIALDVGCASDRQEVETSGRQYRSGSGTRTWPKAAGTPGGRERPQPRRAGVVMAMGAR